MAKIVSYGEILWDVFPKFNKIGGAPLNVAMRLSSLGNEVMVCSSVGSDPDGEKLIDHIASNNLSVEGIQINTVYKTSKVDVILDDKGSASYNITFPCAWDHIHINEDISNIVNNSDAFVFGSLAARNDISRQTLFQLLEIANYKIFDVNLRPPHYDMKFLVKLMGKADFIKFNDDELSEICGHLSFKSDSINAAVSFISKITNTQHICVTLGKNGALLFINNVFFTNTGYPVKVKDTVGAGDSFLASLINELLRNQSPQKALDFACAVGAMVAGRDGANPEISKKEIMHFMNTRY